MDEGSVLRASHDDAGGEFDDGAAGGWEPQVLSGADANGSGDRDADGAADGAADWAGGWFRDPTRHHELRYRDESGWTQRVSNFGVEGLDPYWAPPGWYRDPSRRARHRYWGDDGWTAKTAAKGFRLHDPVDAAWPPPHPGHGRNDLTLTPKLPDPPRNESGSVAVPPPIRRALGIDDANDVGHWSYRWPGRRW